MSDETQTPEPDVEPTLTRPVDWLWRPRYMKAWWALIVCWQLLSLSSPIIADYPGSTIAYVLLNPLAPLVLFAIRFAIMIRQQVEMPWDPVDPARTEATADADYDGEGAPVFFSRRSMHLSYLTDPLDPRSPLNSFYRHTHR